MALHSESQCAKAGGCFILTVFLITASYPRGTRGFFPGSKAVGAWSWPLTSI